MQMLKNEWMKDVNFIPFRNNLYELLDNELYYTDHPPRKQIPLDIFFIVSGELYFKWFVCCFTTWLYYTNILNCKIHLLMSRDIYEHDECPVERMEKLGIDIIVVDPEDVEVNENDHRLCKYNYIYNNDFENDLIIVDADVFVGYSFDLRDLLSHDNLCFVRSSEPDYAYYLLLERYALSYKGGLKIGWEDFLKRIHQFVSKYNNIEFEDFVAKIFKPDYAWANAGVGKIPARVYKDERFIDLCNFSKYELYMPSDEFVYFIYSNFFGEKIEYLNQVWEGTGDCFQPLRHIHNNADLYLIQELIRVMIQINPQVCYWHYSRYDNNMDKTALIDTSTDANKFFFIRQDALEKCALNRYNIADFYWKDQFLFYTYLAYESDGKISLNFFNYKSIECKHRSFILYDSIPNATLIYFDSKIEDGSFVGFDLKIIDPARTLYVNEYVEWKKCLT